MAIVPITVNSIVEVQKPICPCKGGGFDIVTSKILKVIPNATNVWYYLENGTTVKHDRVVKVIKQG